MRRLLVAAAVAAGVAVALRHPEWQNDFEFDWLTVKAFLTGIDPYVPVRDLAAVFGVENYPYIHIHPRTPAALLLQAPIGLIPADWVFVAGRMLTLASAFLYAIVLAKLANADWVWFVAATPVVLLFVPFSQGLYTSQTSFLVGGLIGLTWLMGDRHWAGLPLAGAVALKLWPWVLIPGLWLTGRRKAAVGAAVGFAALNIAAMPGVSIGGLVRMLGAAPDFTSLSFWNTHPALLAAAALIVVAVGSRWVNAYWLAVPVGLLFAPVLWLHYLPVLLAPLVARSGAQVRFVDPKIFERSHPRKGAVTPRRPMDSEM